MNCNGHGFRWHKNELYSWRVSIGTSINDRMECLISSAGDRSVPACRSLAGHSVK